MSVCKHVLVALALITACGHLQASRPVPTAAAATAMSYGIEIPDAAVAELAEVAPVAASVLLAARAQPTNDPVDMRQNASYFSATPNARRSEERRGGKDRARTSRSRGCQSHK